LGVGKQPDNNGVMPDRLRTSGVMAVTNDGQIDISNDAYGDQCALISHDAKQPNAQPWRAYDYWY